MKLSTEWLKELVPYKGSVEKVAEDLTMAGLEVEKIEKQSGSADTCFDVEIVTNRPDCISHIGVAREIAAVRNLALKKPKVKGLSVKGVRASDWKVELVDAESCPYYSAVYIEGVQENKTPDFMRKRLETCGLRSVSLLVDITNYVLLETGQPLHAFDADLIGEKKIVVRKAKPKEKFIAINGDELSLTSKDLVIADGSAPVALAGVMGGKTSEVSVTTKNVILESAFFAPRSVRFSSKRHGLASDSSYRFERRVDPNGVDEARNRALEFIIEYAKPKLVSQVLKSGKLPETQPKKVSLKVTEVEKVLGVAIASSKIKQILSKLGLKVLKASPTSLDFQVPTFRPDLTRSVDLIEEIARIYGYHNIPETLPQGVVLHPELDLRFQAEEKARQFLSSAGLYETVTFSLIPDKGIDLDGEYRDHIRIVNPQNRELSLMRPTLVTSLLQVIQNNIRHGAKRVCLFEIANTYRQKSKKSAPQEEKVLAIALYGVAREKNWADSERAASYYDLKGTVESVLKVCGVADWTFEKNKTSILHDSGSETLNINKMSLGFLGEVHPDLRGLFEIDQPVFYAEVKLHKIAQYAASEKKVQEIPRYPAIERDIALVVPDEVKAGDVIKKIKNLKEPLLREVALFDLFCGGRVPKGSKSLAFQLTYQSQEKTLVSEDIQEIHSKIAKSLSEAFEASFQ